MAGMWSELASPPADAWNILEHNSKLQASLWCWYAFRAVTDFISATFKAVEAFNMGLEGHLGVRSFDVPSKDLL